MTDALNGISEMGHTLINTLREEENALEQLEHQFERQMDALRSRQHEALDQATLETNEVISALGLIRQNRERQVRLLGRMLRLPEGGALLEIGTALKQGPATASLGDELLTVRQQVRSRAELAQARCDEMEFALQYAIQLGREIVQALHGSGENRGARVYTAEGQARVATRTHSLLNKMG